MFKFLIGLIYLLMMSTPSMGAKPTDCGQEPSVAPSFSLTDRNSTSATATQTIKSDDFLGRVWVIYWAQAS